MKRTRTKQRRRLAVCALIGGTLLTAQPLLAWAQEPLEETYALDQIVITANRIPAKAAESAANVSVVTREQIERTEAKSLVEVLKNVNGVAVSGQGVAGGEQTVLLNGDSRIIVMVDGRRLNLSKASGNYPGATYDLNSLPTLDNVERIEIVKGAGSAQYGSDAVGGVINIITRKGGKNQTTLDVSQGSWGTGNYSLTHSGSQKDWSWFLTAGKSHQDHMDYKDSRSGNIVTMPNSRYDQNSLTFRLDKQLTPDSSLTFNFEHADDEKGQPGDIYYTDYYSGQLLGPDTRTYLKTLTNNAALTYNYKMKAEIPAHLRVYQNYFRYDYHDYSHGSTEYRYLKHDRELGADWQDGWRVDKNNLLTAGLEWRYSDVSDPSVYTVDKTVATVGAYLEDRLVLDKKWTLTPGVRYDNHSMFGGHVTPRAAINYQADAATNVYLSWGMVFRAPTTDDLFWNQPNWGMIGNPDLKPETGHTTTVGLNRKLGKNTTLTASYFQSELTDAIRWVDIGNYVYQPQNVDRMRKQGAEISLQTTLSPEWKLNVGYSWLKRQITDASHADLYDDPTNPAPSGYRLGVGYTKKFWDISLNLTGASGRSLENFSSTAYWVWDLAANYQLDKNTKLYFKWNNITSQAYEIWSGGSAPGSYPMPSASWQVGIKYTF